MISPVCKAIPYKRQTSISFILQVFAGDHSRKIPNVLGPLGVCLAVMIPLSLAVYPGEASSTNQRVAIIVSVGLVSVAVAAGLIATFSGIRWIYARRRRPLVWIAIRVLTTASGKQPCPFRLAEYQIEAGAYLLACLENKTISSGRATRF